MAQLAHWPMTQPARTIVCDPMKTLIIVDPEDPIPAQLTVLTQLTVDQYWND